jgi:hypothetical protein
MERKFCSSSKGKGRCVTAVTAICDRMRDYCSSETHSPAEQLEWSIAGDPNETLTFVARQSGWEGSDNQDGHFGGRGDVIIVAAQR